MTVPEKAVSRYIKVKALAVRGATSGERNTARKALSALEAKYPNIRWAAENKEKAAEQQEKPWNEPPPGQQASAPQGPTGNWENIFQFFSQVVTEASQFTQRVGNVVTGRMLASEYVTTRVRNSDKTEMVLLTFRIPYVVLDEVDGMNDLQRRAFKDVLHAKLEEDLDSMISD